MARRKSESPDNILDFIDKQTEKVKALPVRGERWYVVEVQPRRCIDHHWDDWAPEKRTLVSSYFQREKDLQQWLEHYDPDPGNTFETRHEYLREFTELRWSSI